MAYLINMLINGQGSDIIGTGEMILKLDSITFRLKEYQDLTWLSRYGKAFWCVDQTGSGCICIGMKDGDKKYFCRQRRSGLTGENGIKLLRSLRRHGKVL